MTTPAAPDTVNSVGATDDASKGGLFNSLNNTTLSTIEQAIATKATNAATSATNAKTSETNAATSATQAAATLDEFDDRYLGNKTSDPTVDNDGNALLTGALYFNTNDNVIKAYTGSAWINIKPTSSEQTNINSAVANASNINAVVANATNINAVNANSTNINAVNSNSSNINTVAGDTTEINAVAGNATNINTVAGISSNVTTVAGIQANVTTVANNNSNVTSVAGNASNINTVAGAISNVNTVGSNISHVSTVSGAISNVNTVATNITNVNAFANTYFIGSSAPSGGTIGSGDLWYDTNTSQMKVYNGSAWVTFVSTYDTDDLSEGSSNLYYTNTRADARITNAFSNAVSLGNNLTVAGELRGPATFVIDPAVVGNNTGLVQIKGSLQVDGTTTTVNSQTLDVTDKNITIANGSANAAAANGGGLTIDCGSDTDATFTYANADDSLSVNKTFKAPAVKINGADAASQGFAVAMAIAL